MKSLKLTNLEKMNQDEMQQIKGGLNIPWVGGKINRTGDGSIDSICVCVTSCDTATNDRAVNGATAVRNSARNAAAH